MKSQTHLDVTIVKDFSTTEKNTPDPHYVKDVEKAEPTTWTVNNHRTAQSVNKTMYLIQKSVKYGKNKKNIRNKTHKKNFIAWDKKTYQMFHSLQTM